MPDNAVMFAVIPLAVVAVLGGLAFFMGYRGVLKRRAPRSTAGLSERKEQPQQLITDPRVLRDGARIMSQAADERAALVQFLDAASGDCRKAQPFVEGLGQEFGEHVTFLVRYFPRPGDPVSEAAAVAVEAAAQQGRFNEMLAMMYETQPQWTGTGGAGTETFRQFAANLELDLAAFDQAVADSHTIERIEADKARGIGLGVRGTPTFFLLDRERAMAASPDQFRHMVAQAAGR